MALSSLAIRGTGQTARQSTQPNLRPPAPTPNRRQPMAEHKVSEYRVYPTGYDEATFSDKYTWTITVAERDTGRWAVKGMFGVLNTDGEWEYEPSPSNREDDFLKRCRFTEEEALRRALEVVDA